MLLMPWGMMLVYLKLKVKPNPLHAWAKSSTTSEVKSPMKMLAMLLMSWDVMLVSLTLKVKPSSSRMSEAVDESLKRLLRVSCQGCIICEEHLAYENPSCFSFGTKAGQVEETAIDSALKKHSVLWLADGIGQQQPEKHF